MENINDFTFSNYKKYSMFSFDIPKEYRFNKKYNNIDKFDNIDDFKKLKDEYNTEYINKSNIMYDDDINYFNENFKEYNIEDIYMIYLKNKESGVYNYITCINEIENYKNIYEEYKNIFSKLQEKMSEKYKKCFDNSISYIGEYLFIVLEQYLEEYEYKYINCLMQKRRNYDIINYYKELIKIIEEISNNPTIASCSYTYKTYDTQKKFNYPIQDILEYKELQEFTYKFTLQSYNEKNTNEIKNLTEYNNQIQQKIYLKTNEQTLINNNIIHLNKLYKPDD